MLTFFLWRTKQIRLIPQVKTPIIRYTIEVIIITFESDDCL